MSESQGKAQRQVEIRDALITALHADLIGPMRDDELLSNPPSRWYLTGFLVPTGAAAEHRVDPLSDEGLDNQVDAQLTDEADDSMPVPRAYLPSSIGLSFRLPTGVHRVEATASWGQYQELDAQTTAELVDTYTLRAEPADPDDINYRYWRRVAAPRVVLPLDVSSDGAVRIPGGDGVLLQWISRPLPEGGRAITVFLVNGRTPAEKSDTKADERVLFQAGIEIACPEGFAPRVRTTTSSDPDERRGDLQFRNHVEWAVGHGVSAQAWPENKECRRIATTWHPTARVYRMKPTAVPGVLLSMDALGQLDSAQDLRAGMEPLITAYQGWIDAQAAKIGSLSAPRQQTAHELLDEARLALSRLHSGLDRLEDPQVLEAFRAANQTMAQAARKARPDDEDPSWRLFQLAFVLLNLDGISDPAHPDRARVDLLFFPTGGGKTEAYLGVAAIILILRRLRGQGTPHGGAGVAVMLRYTLRLLTLDQLNRAAQLVCALEVLRRTIPEKLGTTRFSIGLWVGRQGSANTLKDAAAAVKAEKGARFHRGAPALPLKRCPWCDTPFRGECFEMVGTSRNPVAMIVGCANVECDFQFGEAADQPPHRDGLPIVVVDEQIYRELPSILVGTVDKFASLPWRGAVGSLFGKVRALDPDAGFYGHGESVQKGMIPMPPEGLPPPALVIQDELHLISGPLGTMVGLYETAIDALCRTPEGHGPKILASTATARRASQQIQALFCRDQVHLFPPQGLDDGDTFFATLDKREERARVYVGIAASGRSAKVLAARTYTALLCAAQRHWEQSAAGLDNPADTYMTMVAYFNALKELGGAQRLIQEDVAQRARKFDQRHARDDESSEFFARRSLGFDIVELTSRQDTSDIAKAITELKRPFSTGKGGSYTDVLLASSMISVGVDIGRLGLMVVNGQPKTTAEYIQATSRVGRETPGLVVTALNLYKPRDRSHYERFTAYHGSFYRDVEASSVTPFSGRAVDRGLAGLVVGLARHLDPMLTPPSAVRKVKHGAYDELEERVVALLRERARAHRDGIAEPTLHKLADEARKLFKNWREVVRLTDKAAGTLVYSPWEKSGKQAALLSSVVDDLTGDRAGLLDTFRAPTSMRDVEPEVHVWVDLPRKKGAS